MAEIFQKVGNLFFYPGFFLKKSLIPITLVLIFTCLPLQAREIDNSIYAGLLKKYVIKNHVDYDGFKADETLVDQYLDILGRTDANTLSRNHQFAFYINVYNAFTIKLVLTRYPEINSIREIGSFFSNPWSKKFIFLNGQTLSLDTIEHKILRPRFKDPRVHFAINCAARSCPPLFNTPYDGNILDAQLDERARAFINDPKQIFFKENKLFISKIFKWFEEDFSGNPVLFLKQYGSKELNIQLNGAGKNPAIEYLPYDWSLNRY